jgi:predicted esterase
MQEHKIQVSRTASYYSLGEEGASIKELWMVCHGYAQLATSLLRKFEALNDGSRLILAPEGLSRFYWNGFSGKVVASWMTRHNRLDEIEDYSNFLSQLYEEQRKSLPSDVKLVLFGFSQGCATLCRWMMKCMPDFDHLFLWGGFLPEDLDYSSQATYLESKKLHFVYGKKDEFLSPERLEEHAAFIARQKLKVNIFPFDGRHVVDSDILGQVLKKTVLSD